MDSAKRKRIDYVIWKKASQMIDDEIRILEINTGTLSNEVGNLVTEPDLPHNLTEKIKELIKSKEELKFLRKIIMILERNIEGVIKNETELEKEIRFNRDRKITQRV